MRIFLAPGLGRRLAEHAVWRGLLRGAQLVPAGEHTAPLGGTTP